MEDARSLQYGIDFQTDEAESSVDRLTEKVGAFEAGAGAAETGAQRLGSGIVSACQTGREGLETLSGSAASATDAVAGTAAQTKTAGDAAKDFGDAVKDAGDDTAQFEKEANKAAQGAESLGAAFRSAMADGLEAGNGVAKSFGTGVTGALNFSRNEVRAFSNNINVFASNLVVRAKNMTKALQNPIQTIRVNLVKALRSAREAEDDTGDGAEEARKHLIDFGQAGEDAGSQIKESISGALKAFVGIEAIKKGAELLKQFGAAAVSAFGAAESSAAKFERVFSEDAAQWAEAYADAVHRSTSEVQNFMVQNQKMYRELGLTSDAAEFLSEMTTSLAYDFGNAFKMDDAEALAAIQSAIQGDTAALTEFGIVLDDAALKQSAAAMGLGTNIDALDEAAAAQVRFNAILAQSEDIQQAAANSTGGLTNSVKSLRGIWSDFLVDAGAKFAPAIENLIGVVLDAWPTLEPMLLSFAEVLADGLTDAVPILSDLAQDLIPAVSQTLGVLMQVAGPVVSILGELAGSILPPLARVAGMLAQNALPPLQAAFEQLDRQVLQPLLPVIEELAVQVLPVLGMALETAASLVVPLAAAFLPLLTTILPPLGGILQELAAAFLPPLSQALQVVTAGLTPLVGIAGELLQSVLPLAEPLLTVISTVLSDILLPVIEKLSPVLSFVCDVLGTVVGWVSDLVGLFAGGLSKVTDWFSGLFGGAKEGKEAVEELTGAVGTLDGVADRETTLAIDTSAYSKEVTAASKTATAAVSEAMAEAQEVSEAGYTQMASDAEAAYTGMAAGAEDAWSQMTKASSAGADRIVQDFGRIASAAQSVGSAEIRVTAAGQMGTDIPHNARGTDHFEGGWTHMNEEGGELAYLPSGTAILPADKTDAVIRSSTSTSTAAYEDNSQFAPEIHITLSGNVEEETADELAKKLRDVLETFWREKKEQEYHERVMQDGYAIL